MSIEFGDPRLPLRFWSKVNKDLSASSERLDLGPCWVWGRSKTKGGYGQFHWQRTTIRTHVLAYQVLVGEVPQGLELDHLCRNRACVNPEHLEAVTRFVNLDRSPITIWVRRRAVTHCPQGHPYAGSNLGHDGKGRRCRNCDARRKREWKARQREARNARGIH